MGNASRCRTAKIIIAFVAGLEIDETTIPLACRPRAKRIVLLLAIASIATCWPCLRWHLWCTGELLTKKWIVASLSRNKFFAALTCRVDERARSCVLGWDTKIACVAKGILSFTRGEQSVQASMLRVLLPLLLGWLRRLEVGDGVRLGWLILLLRLLERVVWF